MACMSLSVSLSARTCHNDFATALPWQFRSKRVQKMIKSNNSSAASADLAPAEAVRLLAIVGRQRRVDEFEILFRHYAPRIRAFMMTKTRDRQVAEELMQETMVSVWNKAVQFDPERGNVSAWIYTIARNIRIDAYRRRRPMFDVNDPALVADDIMPADLGIEQVQDAKLLREAMETLPAEQLTVLKRAFFDEVSHSAIAQEMDLPLGTVKSRIRLAFEKLRLALEDRR